MPLTDFTLLLARGARMTLLLLVSGAAFATAADREASQPHETIEAAVQRFVGENLRGDYVSYQVDVATLDPRLRLAACSRPLQASLPPGSRLPGKATLGVSCTAPRPWTIYISAEVKVSAEVAVTKRLVVRGSTITADDVGLELRELDPAQTYLRDTAALVGKTAKRPLAAGSMVAPDMVTAPLLVRRGQQVVIVAAVPGIDVRMQGTALGEGGAGDRIQVRNLLSKRIIEATVIEAGVARVAM